MIRDVGTPQTLYAWRDAATSRRRRPFPVEPQAGAVDGFAILEVIIAFTMLLIILVPAAALFSTVIGISANTRNRVQAANLAAEQIDVGRATSFGTLALSFGWDSPNQYGQRRWHHLHGRPKRRMGQ